MFLLKVSSRDRGWHHRKTTSLSLSTPCSSNPPSVWLFFPPFPLWVTFPEIISFCQEVPLYLLPGVHLLWLWFSLPSGNYFFHLFFLIIWFIIVILCVLPHPFQKLLTCMCALLYYSAQVEIRGQLTGVCSLFPPSRYWGLNSGSAVLTASAFAHRVISVDRSFYPTHSCSHSVPKKTTQRLI